MNQVNAADQARQLATLFRSFAIAVFSYRQLHSSDLSEMQRDALDDRGEALLDAADQFTATAIAATVSSIKDSLDQITQVTQDAKQTLKTMNNVQEALAIIAAGLTVAGAVASGDAGAVISGLQAFVTAVHPSDGAATDSASG